MTQRALLWLVYSEKCELRGFICKKDIVPFENCFFSFEQEAEVLDGGRNGF